MAHGRDGLRAATDGIFVRCMAHGRDGLRAATDGIFVRRMARAAG